MKTATIALLALAVLSMPAMAQDQNANRNADNPPAKQTEMNKTQPGSQGQKAAESQMNTRSQTGQMQLSSSEVKSIQEKLKSEGFHSGPADGKFGPETKAALEQFQKKNGLSATGEPDQKTLMALGINEQGGAQPNEAQENTQTTQSQRTAKAGKPMNQVNQNQPQNQNQPEQKPGQNEPGAKSQPDQGSNPR
jgi:peptidoglycan hydrolase-like protein with peptidoglycan-binding domain